jgi:deoxyribonuclease V
VLACVDVSYREGAAIGGCVLFQAWTDARSAKELVVRTGPADPYRPGEFYRRELPLILAVLERVDVPLDAVVIDAYVWLGGGRQGLGARLFEALDERAAVVGVAKTAWGEPAIPEGSADARRTIPVRRGRSDKPLYVTAVGMDVLLAAALVAGMHGPHRIPTLIKAVDRLVREQPDRD